ncbi:MAG TPA: hypothetical protein VJ600_01855 [Holophagaceae bacterium]|nr:hypothetical protein [Holophagaceae bacterium]
MEITRIPAPEERSSFRFGLWSLLTNLLCGCFPVAIVLGIFALVRHGRAKALAAAEPDRFSPPAATGMVLGILGIAWTLFALAYVGIISAIAIPALLSQRGRARDRAAMENMVRGVGDLVAQYDKLVEQGIAREEIPARLEGYLRSTAGLEQNPWMGTNGAPAVAFDFHIRVVQGMDQEGMAQAAEAQATELGQCVFVLEVPPAPGQPGFLAGSVRVQDGRIPASARTKVADLE